MCITLHDLATENVGSRFVCYKMETAPLSFGYKCAGSGTMERAVQLGYIESGR